MASPEATGECGPARKWKINVRRGPHFRGTLIRAEMSPGQGTRAAWPRCARGTTIDDSAGLTGSASLMYKKAKG